MNVRGAALAAVLGVAACGGPGPAPPQAAPAPNGSHVPGETATKSRRTHVVPRIDDATCVAAGHDDGTIVTLIGPDACSGERAPVFHITGRLLDADGAPASSTRLRFWTRESMKDAYVNSTGEFDLKTDVDGVTYDVDAILFEYDSSGRGVRRLHVGRLRSGQRDAVLKIDVAPDVLAAGTLLDDAGHPLAGWKLLAGEPGRDSHSSCVAEVETDSAGRFRVTSWTKQPVTLTARAPGDAARTILRQDVDAGTRQMRVTVAPPGIAGHVIVEDGGTPEGAIVRLRREADGTVRSVAVDGTGVFHFDPLDALARYEVTVELSGYSCVPRSDCAGDAQETDLFLIAPDQILEGRALDADGSPLASTWVRFVAEDDKCNTQAMTELDGTFRASDARGVDYEAFALVSGDDGRLVPGPKLGHCRGGERSLQLRASR